MHVARWAAPVLLTGCFVSKSGPAGEEIVEQHGACSALEDVTFESLDEYECGQPTSLKCHWRVTIETADLMTSTFEWRYSDVIESGTVRCDGSKLEIVASPRGPGPIGTYDDATGQLTWNGIVYLHGR